MERKRNQKSAAFSKLELIVVLVVIVVLASMLLPAISNCHCKAPRISCVNNLKQIGIAYRVWESDNNDKFPALVFTATTTNSGGWKDLLTNQNQGAWCWTNYAIMQNELGQSPKVVLCPADERMAATNFTNIHNTNISYFVGVGSHDNFPQSILGGDRNLNPGWTSQKDYGFSPANGNGNDITLQTNSVKDPVSWTFKMHSGGNSAGAGNILLGDASVQQVNSKRFRTDYQPFALDAGNWPSNHVPSAPSFRLIFP